MPILINFVQKKTFKERVWKSLNVIVGIATLVNVTFVGGALLAPRVAQAEGLPTETQVALTTTHTTPTPVANPALGQSCGLDIGLIVDTSGSMDANDMASLKTALKSFAGAFVGTPTQLSLTQFNTNSSVVQGFTSNISTIQSKIDNAIPSSGNGNTNWDSGLQRSASTFDPRVDKSNLIVIATDGSPNRYGYPSATSTFDWTQGLNAAITTANTIKNSGTRIVTIGIGADPTDPNYPNTDYKLKDISGPNMVTDPANITVDTDVIKINDFSHIGDAFANFAKALCGGKILVQKQFDTNGDGQADVTSSDPLLNGWTFDVNGTASDPAAQVTTTSGALQFDNVLSGTNYSVVETQKDGTRLASATCVNGNQPVGTVDLAKSQVTGLDMGTDDTISCTFVNTYSSSNVTFHKVIDNEPNADVSGFTFHANGGTYHDGDTDAFPINTPITVTEEAVDGYTFVDASGVCSVNADGHIILTTSANGGTCTITNHRSTGTLIIAKDVINPDGGQVSDNHPFTVTVSGQADGTIAENTDATYSDLPAGTYTVTETPDSRYTFVSYSQDNDQDAANGAQVTITAGQTTTLTVTNKQKKVKVVVHKNVVGIDGKTYVNDTHQFTASVNGVSGTIAEGQPFVTWVNPGHVTVDETPDANYDLVCITPEHTTVKSGDAPLDVWVINQQLPAHITVVKDVRAWDGSDVNDGHTFMVRLDGVTKNFGENADALFDVAPGTYSATELADANYTLVGSNPSSVTVGSNEQATIVITNKQNKSFAWTVYKTGPASVQAGSQLTYDITWQVSADSNVQLGNLTVTDVLPAHTSFVSCSDSCESSTNTITWTVPGPFVPGQSGVVHLTLSVDNHLDPVVIPNTATVCGDQQPYTSPYSLQALHVTPVDPTHVCKDGTTTTQVLSSYTLAVSKTDNQTTATPGTTSTYVVSWSVNGNAATTGPLIVKDTLPANMTFVSASNGGTYANGVVTWTVGTQNVPANGTLTVVATIASPLANGTDLHNTVQLCDDREQCVTGDDHTTVVSTPSLTITKTNDIVGFTNPGKVVTYTVTVANATTATDSARAVVLTDVLPAGFTYTVGGATTQTFILGDIAPGKSVTTTYTATISTTQAAGTYSNTASAQGINVSKVSATSAVAVRVPQVLGAVSTPSLTITKTAKPTTTNPGKVVTYTVTVTNTGDADATDVVLTDTLPTGFTFVDNGTNAHTWVIGALAANHQRVINYMVLVGTTVKAGTYTNVAVVTAANLDPQQASADVKIVVPAVLGLATTGVSLRDYVTFAVGLVFFALGFFWFVRLSRRHGTDLA